jgi:hypothetical protein
MESGIRNAADLVRKPSRFDTISPRPNLQAWRKTNVACARHKAIGSWIVKGSLGERSDPIRDGKLRPRLPTRVGFPAAGRRRAYMTAASVPRCGCPRRSGRDSLLRQIDDAGVNYVMFLLAFGDLSLSASLRTIAGIAAEIVPAIREMEAQWAPRGWVDW